MHYSDVPGGGYRDERQESVRDGEGGGGGGWGVGDEEHQPKED